jgi:hypothetical protein
MKRMISRPPGKCRAAVRLHSGLGFCGQALTLGCVLMVTPVWCSTRPGAATRKAQSPASQAAGSAEQAPVTAPPAEAAPAVPLTPAEMPPVPPQVSYSDGQLTIIAENCTLGAILEAVHQLTGVSIELPSTASGERMVARLGPGTTRDVLTSLLFSTEFNYIMQAADDDPDEVQSVLLMPRSDAPPKMDGRRSSAPWAQRRAEREPAPNPAPVPDSSQVAADPVIPPQNPSSAGAETSLPEASSKAEASPSPGPGSASSSAILASDGSQPTASPTDQMMQGLRRLYEQRRQMQEQQNQSHSKSTAVE